MSHTEQPSEDHVGTSTPPSQPPAFQTLKVSTRLAQIVGWGAVVVFTPTVLLALGSGEAAAAFLFAAFAVVGAFLAYAASGVITMDSETITLQQRGQSDGIRWDEVISIETTGDTIIFNGTNKCLVLIEPLWWRGQDRAAMLKRLSNQIEQRELPVRSNLLATFRRSRNTRGM